MKTPWLVLLVVGLVLVLARPAHAQTRSLVWERWDVVIENVDTTANRFDVREIYDVRFDGTFRFGSAVIPTERLENITNVQVLQDGDALRESCTLEQAAFCVERGGGEVSIVYYFRRPISNGVGRFEIRYSVSGALRIYEGGDQLWWDAIPDEHFGFPILSSTITVVLPTGSAPREGVDPVETYGANGDVRVNGSLVTAAAINGVGAYESFSIRVQYPHNPDARVSSWQADFEQQRAYDENVRPLVNIGVIALSLLLGLGGSLGILLRYVNAGRDPDTGPVPEYLSEPPSDLPPAVVGTLIDERVDVRDVLSTLLDLGQRGYLVIEEGQEAGFLGIGSVSRFAFKRTDKSLDDLRPYETRFMNALFPGDRMERTLESLRNTFYAHIPTLKGAIYEESMQANLFRSSPQSVRTLWGFIGVALLILAIGGFFVALSATTLFSDVLWLLPLALGFVGAVALAFSAFMPAKTRAGAEEAAKWRAFREYMRNLERYTDVSTAANRFADFMPYAVAFGLNHIWIQRFARVANATIPPWYWPTYVGGPYGRGYVPGTPMPRDVFGGGRGLPGELARAGEGGMSLDDISNRMGRGLEAMSSGLSNMLESASRVMTSVPQASGGSGRWSSGGGSWSGGGFSGGGGSGGGSRGFG